MERIVACFPNFSAFGSNVTSWLLGLQYIPRNMHTAFALLCFVVVIHWLIFQYPPGLLHWHCGNLTIAPVPAKQPWWIWINTSCEFIMNDCITTTKQSTTQPCAYFLGYTVVKAMSLCWIGDKPLPDTMRTKIHNATWYHELYELTTAALLAVVVNQDIFRELQNYRKKTLLAYYRLSQLQ